MIRITSLKINGPASKRVYEKTERAVTLGLNYVFGSGMCPNGCGPLEGDHESTARYCPVCLCRVKITRRYRRKPAIERWENEGGRLV